MTADLSALIARLESAEAGSRELDAHVEVAVRAIEAAKTGLTREHWAIWRASSSGIVGDGATQYASAPVTTSLDAALALADRVLPGVRVMVERDHDGKGWAMAQSKPEYPREMADASTPALALCIATLRAKLDGYAAEGEVNKNPKAQEG